MKKIWLFILIILACNFRLVDASYEFVPSESEVTFSFKSTLHAVEGKAEKFKAGFDFKDEVLQGGEVKVSVPDLTTFHKKRDKKMYQMFQVEEFPEIIYRFQGMPSLDLETKAMSEWVGVLKIRDKVQEVKIPIIWEEKEGRIVASGEVVLSLEAFDLKPPSVIGVIRVFDPVEVKFTFIFEEK